MDELKQSVQLAVHEQKDPLLIYKFEAFELFKKTVDAINKDVISFLFKADIPQQQQNPDNIQEASEVPTPKQKVETSREEVSSDNPSSSQAPSRPQVTETIVRDTPKINRNDTVTVKHIMTGKTEEMKYKKAEPLLKTGEWVII